MSSGDRGDRRDLGRPRGAVLTAVATSALAAFSVLVLVGVLILAFGQDGDSAKERRARERAADPVLTASPAPSALGPVPARTADPGETADPAGTATAEPSKTAAPGTGPGSIEVVVLNETKRDGLAATFRDLLEAGGWTVKRIGDFTGNVPLTTVYYPPGFEAQAEALEAQFSQVNRIRPAFSGIGKKRLTVILAGDYPKD